MQSAQAELLGARLSWAAVSDPGLVRERNEDSVLAEPGIYVVADGMGGHSAGDVASQITVETLRRLAVEPWPPDDEAVPAALADAHSEVRAVGEDRVIGSTVTGLLLSESANRPTWLIWNVGDSRCYRLRPDRLEQMTTDHTVVAELVASGALTESEAAVHPERHVITRAIGADERFTADYWLVPAAADDRFLLCSDGLTNEVTDEEIRQALAAADTPAAAAIELLTSALERGGHDNVSAVVVFCTDLAEPLDAHSEEATTPRAKLRARTEPPPNTSEIDPSDPPTPGTPTAEPPLISEVPR